MSPILTALVLAIWTYICVYDMLSPNFIMASRPLIAGFVTGLIVGDVKTGMLIGGTLELMALGVYTYGGATIPDYMTGAILGTYFGKGGNFDVGIALAIPAALLMTQVDVLNRFLNFVFVHRADRYAEAGDDKGFDRMMAWTSHMIWGFSRAIPVFLAIAFGEPVVKSISAFFESYPWINKGITAAGGLLPAIGYAMLLKILPVDKYPAFLLLGFVLFAYLKMPLLGIALFAVAVAGIFQYVKYQKQEA
ncbi:MAG: mannose system component [Chloroflexota bacterium]|nr:mannose system component [Chloroflexota bacterium]